MPADLNALRQRFVTLLVTESQLLNNFIAVLEEEREVLGHQNVEPLFELAKKKSEIASQLQRLADSRALVLSQAGQPNSRTGAATLLADQQAELWNSYLNLAARAHNLNEGNGKTITQRLSSNHQALEILLSSSNQPMTYGPDGASRPKLGSRHFGSF